MSQGAQLKPVALIFSISGLIQGIIWFILSILHLLAYNEAFVFPEITLNDVHASYNDYIAASIKGLYFYDDTNAYSEWILNVDKDALLIFMCCHLGLAVIWICVCSFAVYAALHLSQKRIQISLLMYSLVTLAISVVDCTLMGLLAADYNKMFEKSIQVENVPLRTTYVYILIVIGIFMTLAARGYVLLLFNIGSFCYTFVLGVMTIPDERDDKKILYNLPIDAFKEYPGTNNFVEAVNEEPRGFPRANYNNHAFVPDYNPWENQQQQNPQVSQPAQPSQVPIWLGQQNKPNQRQAQNYPQREPTPEIVKTRPETSPYALPNKIPKPPPPMAPPKPSKKIIPKPLKPQGKKGPPIPFPDYSPPESPRDLRSVIKPHSSYY